MLNVIAEIYVQPGKRKEYLAELTAVVPQVRAEAGCKLYQPTIDVSLGLAAQPPARSDVVTVIEQWENAEALKAHLTAPHMLAYRERVKGLVNSVKLYVTQGV